MPFEQQAAFSISESVSALSRPAFAGGIPFEHHSLYHILPPDFFIAGQMSKDALKWLSRM